MDPSSAFSSFSTLAEKVNLDSAKKLISNGVDKLSNATSGLTKRGPTKISKELETQIPKGLPQLNPELNRVNGVKNSDPKEYLKNRKGEFEQVAMIYPSELKYYIKFHFSEYRRILPTKAPDYQTKKFIVLPVPSNLTEAFGTEYDGVALGTIGGLVNAGEDKIRQFLGDTVSTGKTASIANTSAATAFNLSIAGINKVNPLAAELAKKAAGLTPNPYLALIFRNINLRQHTFNYTFAPNSKKELDDIKKIIKQFKTSLLPGVIPDSLDLTLTFPDTCQISFGPIKQSPYIFKKCVLSDMTINYAPKGPAFFVTGDPVLIEISLTFKEIEPYLRRDEINKDVDIDVDAIKDKLGMSRDTARGGVVQGGGSI